MRVRSVSYTHLIRKIRLNLFMVKRIIKIGLPAGLQSVMYALSNIIIQSSVNALGTDTIAAWTAYSKIDLSLIHIWENLELIVKAVYKALKVTEDYMAYEYEYIGRYLPDHIEFVTTQQLEDMYPDCTPKEREYRIAKLHKAVFIEQIGDKLASGEMCIRDRF